MTQATAFDTHKFVKHTTGVGFSEPRAKTMDEKPVNLINHNLAAKIDIEQLRLTAKADTIVSDDILLHRMIGAMISQPDLSAWSLHWWNWSKFLFNNIN